MSLFKFSGLKDRYWAFAGMGRSHTGFKDADGLLFYKLMGSGAGEGFSILPNFGVYALMASWASREAADEFMNNNSQLSEYHDNALSYLHLYLNPVASHGTWGGIQPFHVDPAVGPTAGPMAVLTRARIRLSRMPDFWKYVPAAARAVSSAPGRIFSVGVGEWPLIEQATFSIWDSAKSISNYAYKGAEHARVVKYTRERNWYSEELFARFQVTGADGSWPDEKLTRFVKSLG